MLKSGYIDSGDQKASILRKRRDDFYQRNEPFIGPYWTEALIDSRFVAGDQTQSNFLYSPQTNITSPFYINLMQRYLGMMTGFQRTHRKRGLLMPMHQESDQLCDDYNGCFSWMDDESSFQEIFSESCETSTSLGMSLCYAYPDFAKDPYSPNLGWSAINPLWYMIDSSFKRRDLKDCEGVLMRHWFSRKKINSLLQGREKEVAKIPYGADGDGFFPLLESLLSTKKETYISYDEFHYLTTRTATFLYDRESKQAVEWDSSFQKDSVIEDELEIIKATMPWVTVKKQEVPTVNLGILVGGIPFYDGPNLLGIDRYPMALNLCNHFPDNPQPRLRYQGMSRLMRPLQFLYNLRKMAELSILQSQANTGWIFPVDVVTDPKAFRQTSDGILIPLKKGHTPDEIKRIEPPVINPTIIELSRILKDDFAAVTGINDEMIGANVKDNSGILEMFRQSAGLVTLAKIFDGMDYSLRQTYEIKREYIRKNFTRTKVKEILGRDPHPLFFSAKAEKYSMAVEEGAYSTTQRQLELQQYIQFKQLGMNVADKTIWRAAFLTNKQQAMREAEESAQAQIQAEQQSSQMEMADKQSIIQEREAKSQLSLAKAQETLIKPLIG